MFYHPTYREPVALTTEPEHHYKKASNYQTLEALQTKTLPSQTLRQAHIHMN